MAGREGLTLALVNLLENARAAMGGQGHLIISGVAEAGGVALSISDDGPGIPAELGFSIFDFNVSGSHGTPTGHANRPASRLGFGLWWVKTLMTRLGGSIAVESGGESGTTFHLYIPLARSLA
jgi:signal transduction histidine kinase